MCDILQSNAVGAQHTYTTNLDSGCRLGLFYVLGPREGGAEGAGECYVKAGAVGEVDGGHYLHHVQPRPSHINLPPVAPPPP
jgi:hypothetical protein